MGLANCPGAETPTSGGAVPRESPRCLVLRTPLPANSLVRGRRQPTRARTHRTRPDGRRIDRDRFPRTAGALRWRRLPRRRSTGSGCPETQAPSRFPSEPFARRRYGPRGSRHRARQSSNCFSPIWVSASSVNRWARPLICSTKRSGGPDAGRLCTTNRRSSARPSRVTCTRTFECGASTVLT